MFTFFDSGIDILDIGLIPLNTIKSPYVDRHDYEPPDDVDTQKYRDARGNGIGGFLSKYEEIDIGTSDSDDEQYSPGHKYGIYPVFFDDHQKTHPVFFKLF